MGYGLSWMAGADAGGTGSGGYGLLVYASPAPRTATMHRRDDDQDPLDLPLGGEREEPPEEPSRGGGPSGWEDGPGTPREADEPMQRRRAGAGSPERRRWPMALLALLALLVLLALAGVVGYLLPRPGPPVLRLDAAMVDFGAVRTGQTAPARELTLESAGERPVRIGDLFLAGPAPEAFEIAADGCSGTSLAPGRSCGVVLRFAPRRPAALRATLEVPAEASNGPLSVPLSGDGVTPEPVVDRRRVEFPPVPVGSPSRPELLTLGNRGGAPLEVAGMALAGPAAGDFVLDGDRCTGESLAPGDECTVRVVFAPDAEGDRRAALRFRFRGRADGAPPLEVAVSGVGIGARAGAPPGETPPGPASPARPHEAPAPAAPPAPPPPPPPEIGADPASVDFGEVPLGGQEGAQVVLRNSGGSAARLQALSIGGPDAASFELRDDRCGGRELAPGERCTVRAVFRPREEGVQQARVAVASPDLPEGSSPVQVPLRGAGAVGRLALGARELEFGEVRVGASTERRLTLGNPGRAPVEIRDLGVRGEAAREFAVTANGCPETVPLPPGERCDLTVRFAPEEEGGREAVLTVRHGGAGAAAEAALRGTGVPAPAPRAEVAPGAVRFGTVRIGGRSEIETVTLANHGSARMAVGEPRVEGPDAGEFHVVAGSCAGASFLVPRSDCTVGVRYSPSAAGAARARLVIPHDAEGRRSVVELQGEGEG